MYHAIWPMTSRPVEHLPGPGWFVATFAVYIVLGVTVKSPVLNWIIGPLWLFLTLFVVPALYRGVRARTAKP